MSKNTSPTGTTEQHKTQPRKAAMYVRMSTDHQKYSTENQANTIREYAARYNIEIIRTYEDAGKSGLSLDGRDALKRLIEDVQAGSVPYSIILVLDVTRWGRFQDADESAYYEYICRRAGLDVQYVAEQFTNDGSLSSTIIKSMKRSMAGEYSRELSCKVFNGQCNLIEKGYRQGGPAGYAEIVENAIRKMQAMGASVHREVTSDLIFINDEVKISVVICRCTTTATGAYRWKVRLDTGQEPDITIAIRMDAENKRPLDYYLLPALDVENPKLRLAENNGIALDAYRFDDLEPFFNLTQRVQIKGIA